MKKIFRQHSVANRTKKCVNKDSVKNTDLTEIQTFKGSIIHSLDGGFCLLSLKKMTDRKEFYKNKSFNEAMRRRMNLKKEDFELYRRSYNTTVKSLFNTRKSMVKFFKKMKRMERTSG